MKCPRCEHDNPQKARFCEECGTPLSRICATCGTALLATAKFCHVCAHPVPVTADSSQRSPESYTPKHLAEKILTSKTSLEGERKQVTVLFADLKGSMELLADRDPEEARTILDPVLEVMIEAVHRYEGTVNQVMGDGIMALFGAPIAHEDHAVRACYAALRMQETVNRHAEDVRRSQGASVRIRIGLNSGDVVVRAIGSDLRMDYTAVGQTTHLAARMEQAATPGSILITPATLVLTQGLIDVKPHGPMVLRGLAQPIDMYEVAGASALRSRFQASAARGLTKFVGRAAEIEQLSDALGLASGGRGQVVAVAGEAGVGKSRLLYEFLHSDRVRGWRAVESGSVSYAKATAYLPVIELLKAYFGIERSDTGREIRDKVVAKILEPDDALGPFLPAFLWLLDVPVADAMWERLDPPQRRQRMLEAVQQLMLHESQKQPLIVVLEDLHWIDSETQAVLDALVESLSVARIAMLVSYRPEYAHGWESKTYYRQLRIDPLPPAGADELLDALLGADASVRPLKSLLAQRSEGTPFFLEESVKTLVEVKALAGELGAYRLLKPVRSIEVPATVKAILAARIDRLPLAEKTVLQAASVIGKDVPYVILEAVAGIPEGELRGHLSRLQSAEFLYETSLFPEVEYTFKHALTHEVTYDGVLHQRRRAYHAAIVDAIEKRYADRLAEHVERLGHHAVRGEAWRKAARYLHEAGIKAVARSLYPDAVTAFKDALGALAHLPEDRDRMELEFDLRIDLRQCMVGLGERQQLLDYLQEAEALARKLDDRRRLAWVSLYMSAYLWAAGGGAEQARKFAEHARGLALTLEDFPLTVAANFYLGIACWASGDYSECERSQRENLGSLKGELVYDRFGVTGFPVVMSRALLAQVLAERGVFGEALSLAAEGVRLGEALNHAYSINMACWSLAYGFLVKGDVSQAAEVCERAIAVAQQRNVASGVPWLTATLGFAYVLAGRAADGLRLLREAHEARRHAGLHSLFTTFLAEAYLMSGQVETARSVGAEAVTLTRQRGERGYNAWALRTAGEIASAKAAFDFLTAERRYQESAVLALELGMRPLVAHCHLGLGQLYRRTGKGNAREHLTTATTMYREMGMTYWLEKGETELREACALS